MKTTDVLERILKNHYDMRMVRVNEGLAQVDYLDRQGLEPDLQEMFKIDPMDDAFIRYANLYGRLTGNRTISDNMIDSYIKAR